MNSINLTLFTWNLSLIGWILSLGGKLTEFGGKKIYEVSYVNTFDQLFLYRLWDIRTQEDCPRYCYQNELSKAHPYSDIEHVLKRERTKDGRVMILVKFKGLDSSFNLCLPER